MKAEDLRTKNVDELKQQMQELLQEQFKMRMQHGAGQLVNTSELRRVRKDIARVQTILRQQRAAAQANDAVEGEVA